MKLEYEERLKGMMPKSLKLDLEETIESLRSQVCTNFKDVYIFKKSCFHLSCGIRKRATNGGDHRRALAPGQQLRRNVATVMSRWRHCPILPALEWNPRSSAPIVCGLQLIISF